jgi:hypothetical protein
MKILLILVLFVAILPARMLAQVTPPAAQPDHESLWDSIARQHIRPGRIGDVDLNVVDYAAIARDPRWKQLLSALESASEPSDPGEKMAFWINAYNVMAIKVVLSKYPVKSIKDAGGWITAVWDIEAGIVAGKMRTLTEIEHQILRPMGDARIHAAIVCASISCPPLRAEAFTAATLDKQLDDQMRVWLANENIGARVDAAGGNLQISSIFKWFAEDFEKDAASVRTYVERYLPEEARARLKPNARVGYLSYDWTLNDSKRSTAP